MPYTAVTLAALQATLAQRVDQSVFWTTEEARLALNEALRDWNLLTGTWRRTTTLSTGAADPVVALGATLTYGMRVTLSTGAPLHPTSIPELDLGRSGWRLETTASGGAVPTAPLFWAPRSLTTIELWPATSGAGTNNLLVDGIAATPILTEAADTVDLPTETIAVLEDYALHLLAFKEGGARWEATLPVFEAFLRAAAEENSVLKAYQPFRRFAGLDRRRDLSPLRVPLLADPAVTILQGGGG